MKIDELRFINLVEDLKLIKVEKLNDEELQSLEEAVEYISKMLAKNRAIIVRN